MSIEKVIRLYVRNEDGELEDLREEYDFAECADTLPTQGDLIVSPWVGSDRSNRRSPAHRMVNEVESRYFLPRGHGDDAVYVAVVVKPRVGTEAERTVVCVA